MPAARRESRHPRRPGAARPARAAAAEPARRAGRDGVHPGAASRGAALARASAGPRSRAPRRAAGRARASSRARRRSAQLAASVARARRAPAGRGARRPHRPAARSPPSSPRAGRVLCGDTGVAHLATAFGVAVGRALRPDAAGGVGPAARAARATSSLYRGGRGDPHAGAPDPGLLGDHRRRRPGGAARFRRDPDRVAAGMRVVVTEPPATSARAWSPRSPPIPP